jgi:hypothetical protein
MKTKKDKCLNPECKRPQYCRGLCFACYQYCRRIIAQGRASWEKLEAAGKVRPRAGREMAEVREWFMV